MNPPTPKTASDETTKDTPMTAEVTSSTPNEIPSNSNNSNSHPTIKIDPITALQDGIDGLSLAMFEALRGLRDAVAPESGNLADGNHSATPESNDNNSNTSFPPRKEPLPDVEDWWQFYRQGDEGAVALVQSAVRELSLATTPQSRDQLVTLHTQLETRRDTDLVQPLAQTVLEKSQWIDEQVDHHIPGLHRTASEQHARIQELLQQNKQAGQELQAAYETARQQRQTCRRFVQQHTCRALGVVEADDQTS